ncbi:MAG: septal ring lytic transglycosylase RlpA family protein [Hymenobacteraceae bacterium]|nr:septal ring lytic transglycosylase RlpA family protein [Hymenobacteraceae bacterium]
MITFHGRLFARILLLLTLCLAFLTESAPAIARGHHASAHRSHGARLHAKKSVSRGRHARRAKPRRSRGRHGINHVRHAARYLAAARRHPLQVGDVQTGKASWYGSRYHGRKTSSGERFDKDALTAAHLSLPFGTRVRVRNLTNDSSVIVRITDRGPFGRGRIVDVSEGAARQLGIFSAGVAHVAMEVLPEDLPEPCFDAEDLPALTPIALEQAPDIYYFLQAGAYQEMTAAEAAVRELLTEQPGLSVVISDETVDGHVIHRVLAGRFTDRIEAILMRNRLQADGVAADVRQMLLAEG